MITAMRLVPATENSKPFIAAAERCHFNELGYVEDEYFMTGTANVYEDDEEKQVTPICMDAPYTTRLMIRRPESIEKFSGNVVIEIVNSTADFDLDRMWISSWPFFTRNGDIYIGISSKGHTVDALKTYDPERYTPINWDNPMPDREIPEEVKNIKGVAGYLSQYELGLFWDMLVDLAKLLRKDSEFNPIRQYGKRFLYLTGWSQSTMYINRMHVSFSYRPENCSEGPLFDGYLSAGGNASIAPISNTQRLIFAGKGLRSSVTGCPEPFMYINTDGETNGAFWYGDFDEPDFKFRTWQLAGTSHDTRYSLLEYYGKEDLDMLINRLCRCNNRYVGDKGEALEVFYDPVFNAAFKALYFWVREDIPAPHAPKIESNIGKVLTNDLAGALAYSLTDAFGNTRGGIRMPSVTYPTASYTSYSEDKDGNIIGTFGAAFPFSAGLIKEIYGSLAHYRELLNAEYDRLQTKGWVLKEDKDSFLEYTLHIAQERGLK